MERVKCKEIVVGISDKCKKLCVSSIEAYVAQGQVHIGNDKEVCRKEVEEIQRKMNGTSKALANIFGVGTDGSEQAAKRTWSNLNSSTCTVPALRLAPKLHKKLNPDGNPMTRPIVGANNCMTSRASEVASDVLVAIVDSTDEDTIECESTEDALSRVTAAEARVKRESKEAVMGSGDVVALYPKIYVDKAAADVAAHVMEADATFLNINHEAAAKYLAATTTRTEICKAGLGRVVPRRKYTRGPAPGVTNPEITTRCKTKQTKVDEE